MYACLSAISYHRYDSFPVFVGFALAIRPCLVLESNVKAYIL